MCRAQLVGRCAAVFASIVFIHVRNLQRFVEVGKEGPATRQLPCILLPWNFRSGSFHRKHKDQLHETVFFFVCFFCNLCCMHHFVSVHHIKSQQNMLNLVVLMWQNVGRSSKHVFKKKKPTYNPSAMHSSSRVSPLRTILLLVLPLGNLKPGRRSPSGLPDHRRKQVGIWVKPKQQLA